MSKLAVSLLVLIVATFYVGLLSAAVDVPVTNGLFIALDGSDVTASGGAVSSWNDQVASGGVENFTNNTVSKQPALISSYAMPNGTSHNVLDFDKASVDMLTLSDDSEFETNTFTTIAVVHADAMNDNVSGYYFCCGYNDISKGLWGVGERSTSNTWFYFARNSAGSMKGGNLSISDDATSRWHIVTLTWNGVSGAVSGRAIDETGELTYSSVSAATASPSNHLYSRIGATTYTEAGGNAFDGQIAEVLIYNKVISSDDIKSVERYLKRKYFITQSAMPPVTNGLLVKLDGTDVTLSGGKVFRWKDQADFGGTEDFLNNTSSTRPVVLKDVMMAKGVKFDVLDFDLSASTILTCSDDSYFETNTFTAFAVVHSDAMDDGVSGYCLMNGYHDISSGLWGMGDRSSPDNTWIMYSRNSAGNSKALNLTVGADATNRWHILSMTWDGDSGVVAGHSIDETGVQVSSSVTGATANPTNHLYCRVGGSTYSSGGNYFFDGQMAEVLIYNRVLSENDRVAVEDFLKYKYFMNQGTVVIIK